MENASKALIIAGAILLSILIIGLGMAVYNNASSSVGSANMDTQEISAHNSKFLAYNGRQKGSNVVTLLNTIQSNNKEFADRQITISFSGTSTGSDQHAAANIIDPKFYVNGTTKSGVKDVRDVVNLTTTYNVSFQYEDNGLIKYCQIEVYSAQ